MKNNDELLHETFLKAENDPEIKEIKIQLEIPKKEFKRILTMMEATEMDLGQVIKISMSLFEYCIAEEQKGGPLYFAKENDPNYKEFVFFTEEELKEMQNGK